MVDVLINCLLKNKDISEDKSSISPNNSDSSINPSDGEENLHDFFDHPLTAATTAMLNIGGTGSDEQSVPLELLCEYYKLPLDKMDKALVDKCGALPDLWTTTTVPVQSGIAKNDSTASGSTLPSLPLLPQAAELLKNRRISDFNGISPQDIDLYCCDLEKQETSVEGNDEIIVPHTDEIDNGGSSDLLRDTVATKVVSTTASDGAISPLPVVVQVKSEPTYELQMSPSPSDSKNSEQSSADAVLSPAYTSHIIMPNYENLAVQYATLTPMQYQSQSSTSIYMLAAPSESRGLPDFYTDEIRHNLSATVATTLNGFTDVTDTASFIDRYIRQSTGSKEGLQSLTMSLPSPDSGIGDTIVTSRDTTSLSQLGNVFYYTDLTKQSTLILPDSVPSRPSSSHSGSSRKSNEYGRHPEPDKIHIPKIHSDVGFKYVLETSISTSQRRDDDRITYMNKGQFYSITMQYIPDPESPLKSSTVRSVIMLMFRDEKPLEEELRTWQVWHNRQHSNKQRILDADSKNSSGILGGHIEDISHNAVAFYWNPLERPVKVNIAVHCLSTDFSNQKGVKGLPLHLQIDTFDELQENSSPCHRGYCQIKVFCDKGAERKTRDEERRAAKRKLAASNSGDGAIQFPGRKPLDEIYHAPCDKSEFYSMADLTKPPILFIPNTDNEKNTSNMELNVYASQALNCEASPGSGMDIQDSDFGNDNDKSYSPPAKRIKIFPANRVLLYFRQESDAVYQPIHVVPITVAALAKGIETKYNIKATQIRYVYKQCKKGITVQFDDEMVNQCRNEESYIIKVNKVSDDLYDVTLLES